MPWQFLSHRIALSKVLTNTFSGEPPSKRLVLVLCALLRHSWAPSFPPEGRTQKKPGGSPLPARLLRRESRVRQSPITVRLGTDSVNPFRQQIYKSLVSVALKPQNRTGCSSTDHGGGKRRASKVEKPNRGAVVPKKMQ